MSGGCPGQTAGTFLYLAGTHAQGTLAAAHYLAENVTLLYKELKTRRFSVLVRCTFDPSKQGADEITSIDAITSVFRHES